MKFKEFKKNVVKWAKDRGIIPNSSFDAQYIKLVEELGELALGIRKRNDDLIRDSIGDIAVVLINLAAIQGIDVKDIQIGWIKTTTSKFNLLAYFIGQLVFERKNKESMRTVVNDCLFLLESIATENGESFMKCCELAWNEIKDRKGYLREDGIFIKEEDIDG